MSVCKQFTIFLAHVDSDGRPLLDKSYSHLFYSEIMHWFQNTPLPDGTKLFSGPQERAFDWMKNEAYLVGDFIRFQGEKWSMILILTQTGEQ